jgi:hypothetical protein
MSRTQLEALGHTHVQKELPAIVRDWCVGDSILCLVQGEFDYVASEAWRKLRPFPLEKVLPSYQIYAGMIVIKV